MISVSWKNRDLKDILPWIDSRCALLLLSVAQGAAGNYGTTSAKQTDKQSGNPFQSIGNEISAGLGLFGKADIRAKETIRFVGKRNGYNIYDFNYIGMPERYRGVMAQEVLKTNPDAVAIEPESGLLMVDYGKLGFEMERIK